MREQLDLHRGYYNFIRPHMSLKFGALYKTPAMQAGLVGEPLTFRKVFMSERTGGRFAAIIVPAPGWSFLPAMRCAA